MKDRPLLVGVVGPCAAGKTTLITGLKRCGVLCRHIAQEHSYVANMWKRLTNPDVLVYLDVTYPLTIQRRNLNWTILEYHEQLHRLRHARENADLVISTDDITPEEVLQIVLNFLR